MVIPFPITQDDDMTMGGSWFFLALVALCVIGLIHEFTRKRKP